MIDSSDISVVVQGAIDKRETPKCLKSIRKFLPEAEIILSTWEGSDTKGLDYDVLILNKDPGSVLIEEHKSKKLYNNLNRQLLSTQEGLKRVSRKYAMKLRSDLILNGVGFLEYFDKFQVRSEKYKLFERKIVTSTLFTRFNIRCGKGHKRFQIPFHISDWWFFGLTEDLRTYFKDTPLVEEPFFTKYFDSAENQTKINPYGVSKFKFAPEQYFGYMCFARNYSDIRMEDASDFDFQIHEKFRQCLVNNFIVLEYKQSEIYLNKYPYSKNEKCTGDQYIDLYNFYRYEADYKKYCDSDYKIFENEFIYKNEIAGYAFLRIYKHFYMLFSRKSNPVKKLEQIFLGIPLSFINLLICIPAMLFEIKKEIKTT